MSTFKATRLVKSFSRRIAAPASKVFPLLCPTLEYDWLPGWSCELVYSDTGVAEDNCIFTTSFIGGREGIWTVSRYEPNKAIEFVVVHPDSHVMKLNIHLEEREAGSTDAAWTYTFTALGPEGNEHIDTEIATGFDTRTGAVIDALEHYCMTGKKLSTLSHAGGHG